MRILPDSRIKAKRINDVSRPPEELRACMFSFPD